MFNEGERFLIEVRDRCAQDLSQLLPAEHRETIRRLFSYSQNIQRNSDVGIVAEPPHTDKRFGKGNVETSMTIL